MEEIVKISGISKKFGSQYAVKNIDMTIEKGDIYGFIGRNGAGKTTLIRMIMGLASNDSGTIKLFNSENILEGRDKIGTIIENPGLFLNMTCLDNVKAQAIAMGLKKTTKDFEEVLKLVGLDPKLKKKAKNYSLGMKQRLAIAVSLISSPELLILDEPTNGLDPEGIRSIRNLILKLNREHKITVLISSHILSELHKLATKFGIIDKGVMIDEFSAEELEEKTKDAFELVVKTKDIENVKIILASNKLEYNLNIEYGRFLIYNITDTENLIIEIFRSDIVPTSYHTLNADLEDYFLKVIGGDLSE